MSYSQRTYVSEPYDSQESKVDVLKRLFELVAESIGGANPEDVELHMTLRRAMSTVDGQSCFTLELETW